DLGVGVALNNSDHLHAEANSFSNLRGHAVTLSSLSGSPGGLHGGHRIIDNVVRDSRMGFQLCGARIGYSRITGNVLMRIADYGIHLEDGSAGNYVGGNRLSEVGNIGLAINGSTNTRVVGNVMAEGRMGIALNPSLLGLCDAGGASGEVHDTLIDGNTVVEQDGAVI